MLSTYVLPYACDKAQRALLRLACLRLSCLYLALHHLPYHGELLLLVLDHLESQGAVWVRCLQVHPDIFACRNHTCPIFSRFFFSILTLRLQ
jgi:hypothetical protein